MLETKKGTPLTLTYTGPPGLTITLFITHELDIATSTLGTQGTCSEAINPSGFHSTYTFAYTPTKVGYYYVTSKSFYPGQEATAEGSATKFNSYDVSSQSLISSVQTVQLAITSGELSRTILGTITSSTSSKVSE
jgi:hypothetical protein